MTGQKVIGIFILLIIIMVGIPHVANSSTPLNVVKIDKNLNIYYFNISFLNETEYRYPYAVSISPDTKYLAVGLSNTAGTNLGPFESIIKIYKIEKIHINPESGSGYVDLSLYRTLGPLNGRALEMKWIDGSKLIIGMDTGIYSDQAYIVGFDIYSGQQIIKINYPGYDTIHGMDYYPKKNLFAVGAVNYWPLNTKIIIYDSNFDELASYTLTGKQILALHFSHRADYLAVVGSSLDLINLSDGSILYSVRTGLSFDVDTMSLGDDYNNEALIIPLYSSGGFAVVNESNGNIEYRVTGVSGSIQTIVYGDYVIDITLNTITVYKFNGSGFSYLTSFAPSSTYYYAYTEKTLFVVSDRLAHKVVVGILGFPKVSGVLISSSNDSNDYRYVLPVVLATMFVLLTGALYIIYREK